MDVLPFHGAKPALVRLAAGPYGDGKIHLLPAWPNEWDVSFKLHAPQQTTVEASVKNGKLIELKVTLEFRRKDVVIAGSWRN